VTGRLPVPSFLSGVLLTAGIFTLLGFAVAARVRSFNESSRGGLVMLPACVRSWTISAGHSPLF
jgi:hypothetical protein